MKKQYIEVPLRFDDKIMHKILFAILATILMPFYLLSAFFLGAPGIKIHLKCIVIGARLLFSRQIPLIKACRLIFFPMDSTRYFEFHEALKNISQQPFSKYLDISSPRMLPLLLLLKNKTSNAEMINPDNLDIAETSIFTKALKLTNRCNLINATIEKTNYAKGSFDLITCISVLEHIPDDKKAIKKIWSLLKPGGRLVLTLPCMAQLLKQYISKNDYGVLSPGSDGYTFWQRYYNEDLLKSTIFSITGEPKKTLIYGEKKNGLFFKNATMKRSRGLPFYHFWRESYMMANEYRYFKSISDLPGEGVVMLELVKQ